MYGCRQTCKDQLQTIGIGTPGDFALIEFQLMQGRFDLLHRYSIPGNLLERFDDQSFELLRSAGGATFESGHETHFAI